jgi:hypothetical protein
MSHYQQTTHEVREFVPTYVVRSDYLPTQVRDGNQSQTAQWVHKNIIFSYENTKNRKEEAEFSPKGQSNSTRTDTFPSGPTRMSESINQSPNNSSAEYIIDDPLNILYSLNDSFTYLNITKQCFTRKGQFI